jgi:DNA invertase Pin-like site-specific DNA recombinase
MSTTSARTPDPVRSLIEPPQGTALAVSYLRVSTKEQAEKGGTDEGFSIPAQREANRRKAEQLGAVIVKEFIDAGESARKADRPELMRMIQYVKQNRVAYCIVHKVDRLARNRADDVTIHLALQEAGVMLVSATENIDETPSGMLLHGIMSTIAEFYSRNLATEVIKGMTQKAATGGTSARHPSATSTSASRDELGREVRTVQLDPDRAPLIEWAYKAYASGNWTVSQLHDELTSRGLMSLPTPKHPSKPLAVSSVHRMLTNPYYKGDVIYRGVAYKGAHDPLVPAEVWYQVQSVLTAHKTRGRGHPGSRPLPERHRLLRRLRLPPDRVKREEPARQRLPLLRLLRPALQAHRLHPAGHPHRGRRALDRGLLPARADSHRPAARRWPGCCTTSSTGSCPPKPTSSPSSPPTATGWSTSRTGSCRPTTPTRSRSPSSNGNKTASPENSTR